VLLYIVELVLKRNPLDVLTSEVMFMIYKDAYLYIYIYTDIYKHVFICIYLR